jgi:carboxyl-terminal processing protease
MIFTPLFLVTLLVLWGTAAPCRAAAEDPDARKFARALVEAIDLLEKEHVQPAPRAQMVRWAIQGLFRGANEPLPAEIADRFKGLEKADPQEMACLLYDARLWLRKPRALEDGKDVQAALGAVFARLEPGAVPEDRSAYAPPEPIICRMPAFAGFSSVGLRLESDTATGMLRVVTPIYRGPAYKAGIRAGDLITHIRIDTDHQNKPLPEPRVYPTRGMSVERAAELIFGPEGTTITLTVIPAGAARAAKKAANANQ